MNIEAIKAQYPSTQINALGKKDLDNIRALIVEVELLNKEIKTLWRFADVAVEAAMGLSKSVGAALIRARTLSGLSRAGE